MSLRYRLFLRAPALVCLVGSALFLFSFALLPLPTLARSPEIEAAGDLAASGSIIGSEIVVSALDNSQSYLAVAYDPQRNEYLVAWTNYWGGNTDIYARRVSASGQVLSWFHVGDGEWPKVAYNPVQAEFLLVYSRYNPVNGDYDLYGRRANYTGPLGNEITIANTTASEMGPALAYSSGSDSYLVAWVNVTSAPPTGHHEIWVQELTSAGQLFGGVKLAAGDPNFACLSPDLAYNPSRNEYLLVYEYGMAGSLPATNQIKAWRLSSSGAVIGSAFNVSASGYYGASPVVACNDGDRCLVAWQRWDSGWNNYDVFARRVRGDGTTEGTQFEVARTTGDELAPAVAHGGGNQFLVTWSQVYTSSYYGVWGRYTFADGTQTSGFEIVPPGTTLHRQSPALTAGADNYLVAWEHERAAGGSVTYQDVHGFLVSRSYLFSGWVHDSSSPSGMAGLANVTVELHGDMDAFGVGSPSVPLAATTSASDGSFALKWLATTAYPYLHVVEFDPPGYTSTGSGTIDGDAVDLNTISYHGSAPSQQTAQPVGLYTVNQFWDAPNTYKLWVFSGHVYSGTLPDTASPKGGVTVQLYGDQDEWPVGGTASTLLASATTDATGAFSVVWASTGSYPYYHLTEVDPAGTTSTGASAGAGGYVKNYNVVSYHNAGPGTYSGSAFWDTAPPGTGNWSFSGHVYRGAPPDTSTTAAGVTVQLYGDQDEWPVGGTASTLLASATTDASGSFTLSWFSTTPYPYFHVMEVDPGSLVSTGASAGAGGYVKNYNAISYHNAGAGAYGGSAFWDTDPAGVDDHYLPLVMK